MAASTTEGIRTESWSHGIVRTAVKQVCFERTLLPLELLVEGFQERSRLKMMQEGPRFIQKTLESLSAVKSTFTAEVLEAVVGEGAEELTRRREEEGDAAHFHRYHECRWEPPLVDEDCHAVFLAISKRRRGYMYAELHKVANLQKPDISKERRCGQRKTPRQMEKLIATEVVSDKFESRTSVRRALWEAHIKCPTAALEEADTCGRWSRTGSVFHRR